MITNLTSIQHHQRILITGERAMDILAACRRALTHYAKPHDVVTADEQIITDAPMVLIVDNTDMLAYDPHVALIDEVSDTEKDAFSQLADGLPKSGTIVYNSAHALTQKICSVERKDVHQEMYDSADIAAAAQKLLKRVGVSEERFEAAK